MIEVIATQHEGKWLVSRWEQGGPEQAVVVAVVALTAVARRGRGNLVGTVPVPYAEAGATLEMLMMPKSGDRVQAVGAWTAPDLRGSISLESGVDEGVLLGTMHVVRDADNSVDYRVSMERVSA